MAESHTVIVFGRYGIVWQNVSNFDPAGILPCYWGRAFFDSLSKYNNTAPNMAIPPLSRQIWSKRRRFITLTVDFVSELLLSPQNTSDNVTVLYCSSAGRRFYFYICFGHRWHFDRRQFPVAIIGGCRYKVFCFPMELFVLPFLNIQTVWANRRDYPSLCLTQRGCKFSQEITKNLKLFFEETFFDTASNYLLWISGKILHKPAWFSKKLLTRVHLPERTKLSRQKYKIHIILYWQPQHIVLE